MHKILKHHHPAYMYIGITCTVIVFIFITILIYQVQKLQTSEQTIATLQQKKVTLETQLNNVGKELDTLKNQDQVKINKQNQDEIHSIQSTYQQSIATYEAIQDLKTKLKDTSKFDTEFALSLKQLSDKDYTAAKGTLDDLNSKIKSANDQIAAALQTSTATTVAANAPVSNTAPGSGYSRQQVQSDVGTFTVALVAADLGSTRVIVDTASDGDCHDNCPVLPLSDYVARSGAYAGINGTYFCPSTYPSCAGKTNSFDLLVMNKNKKYINSDNNVYSTNPAVIFQGNSVRFVSHAQEWGRDTGVDGVISNYPLLVFNDQITFGGNDDPKMGSKGARCFVANKGNTVYIGLVYNATMAEAAHVLKSLGMNNAMNLDEGGSTALWYGGYKAGPGRNLPNALLFVRK